MSLMLGAGQPDATNELDSIQELDVLTLLPEHTATSFGVVPYVDGLGWRNLCKVEEGARPLPHWQAREQIFLD